MRPDRDARIACAIGVKISSRIAIRNRSSRCPVDALMPERDRSKDRYAGCTPAAAATLSRFSCGRSRSDMPARRMPAEARSRGRGGVFNGRCSSSACTPATALRLRDRLTTAAFSEPSGGLSSTPESFGYISQSMAEFYVVARQNADTLFFLIVPVKPSSNERRCPARHVPIRKSASRRALGSADARIGLRNGALVLYLLPLTFAVMRSRRSTVVFKWKPAIGVSTLKSRETGLTRSRSASSMPSQQRPSSRDPTIDVRPRASATGSISLDPHDAAAMSLQIVRARGVN